MLSQSLMRASVCSSLPKMCARETAMLTHLFPQRQSLVRVARQQNTTLRRTFAVSAVVKGTLRLAFRTNPPISGPRN